MRKRNVWIITVLTVLMATGLVACKPGTHRGGFDEFDLEAAVKRIASRLDLDESQQADLKKISAEIAAKAKEVYGDRQAHHQELAALVRQESISRDTVDRMIVSKLKDMQQIMDFTTVRLIAFHATLTDEQREKIAAHIEKRAIERCRFFSR